MQQPGLPRGEALRDMYRTMRDDQFLEQEHGRRRTARWLLDKLEPHMPGRRLLDIGCGHGLLLDEARARGLSVQGLELSSASADYARSQLGLAVREQAIEDLDPDEEPFDAIVLTDVLEHLDDPVAAIDRCSHMLTPDGALVIVTPDPASVTARLAGRRWWGYVPAHACLVPRLTVRELMTGSGLLIVHDAQLRRSFSLDYWARGLAERGGLLARSMAGAVSRIAGERMLSLALGDERVIIARRVHTKLPKHAVLSDRGLAEKVHVVIPAYNAARTIEKVSGALPPEAADRALLVDDASHDRTVDVALEAGLEVIKHSVNRGYGANQKTCYVRAALDGADIVVMVHGDNQYDPALVRDMVRPIEDGRADAVIGSRMLDDKSISGGMPHWKWVGNKALTWVENRAFDRSFSEYHTGYRAFSVDLLRQIPFLRNSDGFVFDQEIFAQIIHADARVFELAIPTRYFLEASSVSFPDSVVYGLQTLWILARFRIDRLRCTWPLLRRPAAVLPAAMDHAAREVERLAGPS